MPTPLTRRGARSLTQTMDRCASAVQDEFARLDIPNHIAMDYALRTDLLTDHIERVAIANEARLAKDPDALSVEEMKKLPTDKQVDDDPKSDDQNTKPNATDGAKMASPEFAQPPKNETGDSVEPGGASGAGWDPNAIADDRGGPYKQEGDEPYMTGEFTQEEFHALRDKQQSGQMPKVDGKLASSLEALSKMAGSAELQSLLAQAAKLAADEEKEEEEAPAKEASAKWAHGFNLSE
ncbi:hypothetical protein N9917_01005 [Deltaproteobacteria bacterium]|nr:hypothetical protein [Deltaproteobacteria bacterium]